MIKADDNGKIIDTIGSVADRVRKVFEEQTGVKTVIGFHELNFTPVSQKEAFKIKLDGTGQ